MIDWIVGLEQTQPYEFHMIECFTQEEDALGYAATYMSGRAGRQISKRTWLLISDDGPNWRLIVRTRI